MEIEKEIQQLTIKKMEAANEVPVSKEAILQKIRSLVEHPYEIFKQQIEPARKAPSTI